MPEHSYLEIPGLDSTDVAVVPSILENAGFFYRVHDGEVTGTLLIRASDREAIRKLLVDYRITDAQGRKHPIPW